MKKVMTLGLILTVLFGTLALVAYATGGKEHGDKEGNSRSSYH